jgi:dCTP diphosphatase
MEETGKDGGAAAAVTLEELRKKMADFAREREWEQYHSPRNLLLALVRPLTPSVDLIFFP